MTEIGQFWIVFRSCSKDFGIQLSQIGRFDSKTFHRITWFYRGLYFIDHILLCFSMKIEIQRFIFLRNHSNFRYRSSTVCYIQYTSLSISKGRPQSFNIFRECLRTSWPSILAYDSSHFQRILPDRKQPFSTSRLLFRPVCILWTGNFPGIGILQSLK